MTMKACNVIRNKNITTDTVIINYLFKVKSNETATSRFLVSLLEEKGKFYDSPSQMAKAFSELYGSQVTTSISILGKIAIFTIRLVVPNHKFIGEDVFNQALLLLKDIIEDTSDERYQYPMLEIHKNELIKHAKELENRAIEMGRFKVLAQINSRANISKPSYGSINEIKKVNVKSLKCLHQRMLNGEITIHAETPNSRAKLKKQILSIFMTKKKKLSNKFEIFASEEVKESELTQKNVPQSAVYLLYSFEKTNSECLSLYKSALHNELFEVVRERNGYCYLIDCSTILIHNLLLIRTYTSLKHIEKCIDLIKNIITNFTLTQDTIESSKLKRINQLETIQENLKDLNSYILLRRVIKEDYDIFKNINDVKQISLSEVNQIQKKLKLVSVVKVKGVNDYEN